MKINWFLFLSLFVCICTSRAQGVDVSRAVVEENEWREGTVTLNDGKILSGQLKLNTKTGLLAFESGSTSRSFTSRNILGFEFFDNTQNKKRNFVTANYSGPEPEKNILGGPKNQKTVSEKDMPHFFEILVELKTFALLSSVEPIQISSKAHTKIYGNQAIGSGNSYMQYSQTETLFIFDTDGNITPILDITNKEFDTNFIDTKGSKTKKLDNKIIEKHTSPHFEELEKYANENKLSFKKKDDLLRIFEYYKTIESN